MGETLKVGDLVPSFELLSSDSLTMIGSLGTSFGADGALEEAGTLGGTDVLEAAEREPPIQAPKLMKVCQRVQKGELMMLELEPRKPP